MSGAAQPSTARIVGAPWGTGIAAGLAVGAWFWPDAARWLALDRDRVFAGALWRLWTGHLVHFSASHLAWNLAVFAAAGGWAERVAPRRTRLFYAVAPAMISVTLLALEPALRVYAGLSGVAAGVLALLVVRQLRAPGRTDRWFWWSVLALIVGKIALEFCWRTPLFARFGAVDVQPVPLAHLAGVACAAAVSFWRR